MLDENFLQKAIDKSIDPDGLRHYLGISIDKKGEINWGPFYSLNENCCVSLGIENCNPDKLAEMLNAYNIPAVSVNGGGYYDTSKILVTETGIKLPLQTPEAAIEEISDIVNVLKANNIEIEGYIHPVTKDGITASVPRTTHIEEGVQIDCSKFDDVEIKEILERRQTTFDDFVGNQMDEAISHAMSENAIKEMTNANYMQSLYRGGTLGNQPYATVAARECKDFVYGTHEFSMAAAYANGAEARVGYKKINGHSYGFIYEYEMAPNQKFTLDYGLEYGDKKRSLEEFSNKGIDIPYETEIYPHQNKLKGVYLSVDVKSSVDDEIKHKIYKIADENGYISKEWEDFINLHPTKSMPATQAEVIRNNEMYQLSKEGRTLSEYTGKNYNLKSQSIDNYLREQLSPDVMSIGKDGKYATSYPPILKEIPDGADLSSLDKCYLAGNTSIGKEVKLPDEVIINGPIRDAMDLSNVKTLKINGDVTFGKDVKLPENTIFISGCKIKGHIPNGLDLSKVDNLVLDDISSIGSGVKLPETVIISGYIPDRTDLSNAKNLILSGDNITFGKDVKLPRSLDWRCGSASGYIPDGTEIETRLAGDVWFGKDCKYDNCYIYIDEPPRLHGNVEYNNNLRYADFSKAETLSFPSGGKITKNMILPENGNVIFKTDQSVIRATEKIATKTAMEASKVASAEAAKTATVASKAKNALLAANKSYDDAFDALMKWGDKHAPQWMNRLEEKTVQKAAEKFMQTKSGQAIAKQIEKQVGKEVAASIAKKIPLLCIGVGAYCVYDRLKEGEYLKALGEGVSALVSNIPGLGTLASMGIDSTMLSDDLGVFEHGIMPKDPNSHMAAESTFVERPEIQKTPAEVRAEAERRKRRKEEAEKKKREAEKKKKAEDKKKAQQFESNLYKYGDTRYKFESKIFGR